MRRLLECCLGHCHVIQQLVHCPFFQGRRQFLVHFQLPQSGVLLIDQQFWLILHQVDEQRLQFRVCLMHHLQECTQLLTDPHGEMLGKGCELRELVGTLMECL